ncbi:unnamed protein product [Rodentolepis nana]|uniref:SAFB-like transcription modulator n=1 Tax=Rodentolepis nana TaxID=102285 RepID=A0A0R3TM01_RODNA|nr:unnamed protein product [Rodentolepis nana]
MPHRLLGDLRVVELRKELAKRGVDRSGMKPVLMERLKEIILKEGRDPLTYDFSKPDEVETVVAIEDGDAKSETPIDDVLTEVISSSDNKIMNFCEANDNEERTESHLTAVSEGSIGLPEPLELEDRAKEDAADQIEDTTTFVVGVGETENDLDYDIEDPQTLSHEQTKESTEKQISKGEEPKESVESILEDRFVIPLVRLQAVNTSSSQVEESKSQDKSSDKSPSKIIASASALTFLRVSNLKPVTKAADLKQHFSVYGNVISGKILVSKRRPGGCVGFLTLATPEDATMCIKKFDGTEYNGRTIRVEKTEQIPNAPQKESLILEKSRLSATGNQTPVSSTLSSNPRRLHTGGKRPDSTRHAKSTTSTLAKSQLKRTLQKARDIVSSKTRNSFSRPRPRSPSRKISRKLEHKLRNSREEKLSRPKALPRPRESYLNPSLKSSRRRSPRRRTPPLLPSRVRYVGREHPTRFEEPVRHSYSEKESLRESYSSKPRREEFYDESRYDNGYYRREPGYSYSQGEELSSRHYSSKPPVVYRRREEEEIPLRYFMTERRVRPRYQEDDRFESSVRYERSQDYQLPSHNDRYSLPAIESRSYGSSNKRYRSCARSSRDDRPSTSSRRHEDPDISWQVHFMSSSHSTSRRRLELETRSPLKRPRSPRRSRSPPRHRLPRELNESRSPVRYSRRLSPSAPPIIERSQRSRNDDYAHHPAPPLSQHQMSSSAYPYSRRSGGNDRSSYSNMMASIPPQHEPRRTEKVFDYGHKPSSAAKYNWNDTTQSRSRSGAGYDSTSVGGFSANGTADCNLGGVGRSGDAADYGASRWSLMGNPPRPPRY